MLKDPIYLSAPAVRLPETVETTDEIINELRDRFRGDPEHWPAIQNALRLVFDRCGTTRRYREHDPSARIGRFAAQAARACLQQHGVAPDQVDMVIHGGLTRDYFEPATAMEVAARLGIERVQAFDVTSACVGMLQAVQIVAGMFQIQPELRTALVVSAEITRDLLADEVDQIEELAHKAAGFTISDSAAAWLVSRDPLPGGCAELVGFGHLALPGHWSLCQTPVDGTFTSYTRELFKLNVHVAPALRQLVQSVGWTVEQLDRLVLHQPGEMMNNAILDQLGVKRSRHLASHQLYANTISTAVAFNLRHSLDSGVIEAGDKLLLGGAAAGFTLVALLAQWQD